jgi:hypothetical protein
MLVPGSTTMIYKSTYPQGGLKHSILIRVNSMKSSNKLMLPSISKKECKRGNVLSKIRSETDLKVTSLMKKGPTTIKSRRRRRQRKSFSK